MLYNNFIRLFCHPCIIIFHFVMLLVVMWVCLFLISVDSFLLIS